MLEFVLKSALLVFHSFSALVRIHLHIEIDDKLKKRRPQPHSFDHARYGLGLDGVEVHPLVDGLVQLAHDGDVVAADDVEAEENLGNKIAFIIVNE